MQCKRIEVVKAFVFAGDSPLLTDFPAGIRFFLPNNPVVNNNKVVGIEITSTGNAFQPNSLIDSRRIVPRFDLRNMTLTLKNNIDEEILVDAPVQLFCRNTSLARRFPVREYGNLKIKTQNCYLSVSEGGIRDLYTVNQFVLIYFYLN